MKNQYDACGDDIDCPTCGQGHTGAPARWLRKKLQRAQPPFPAKPRDLQSLCDRLAEVFNTDDTPDELCTEAREAIEELWEERDRTRAALETAARELEQYVDLQQKLDYMEYAASTQKKLDIVKAAIGQRPWLAQETGAKQLAALQAKIATQEQRLAQYVKANQGLADRILDLYAELQKLRAAQPVPGVEGWRIEVRTIREMELGLVRDDIADVAFPPLDPRRYTEVGRQKMGLTDNEE